MYIIIYTCIFLLSLYSFMTIIFSVEILHLTISNVLCLMAPIVLLTLQRMELMDVAYSTIFHVAKPMLPQDVMHLLFEGVIPWEVKLMLTKFIKEKHYFKLRSESRNNPPIPLNQITFLKVQNSLSLVSIIIIQCCKPPDSRERCRLHFEVVLICNFT